MMAETKTNAERFADRVVKSMKREDNSKAGPPNSGSSFNPKSEDKDSADFCAIVDYVAAKRKEHKN